RAVVRRRPAARRRSDRARAGTGSPDHLGRVRRGEGAGSRAAPRVAGADGARVAVATGRRGSAGRLSPLPGGDEDALPGPGRSVDGRPAGPRSPLVRARDGEGAGAGVRPLVSPRGGLRRHVRPRRPVRALPGPISRATPGVVPRRGLCRDAGALSGGRERALALRPLPARGGGRPARDPPEDGARHESRASRIVVIEEPAHQLAGGEEPGDWTLLAVDDLTVRRDLEAAEGERDARRHGKA